MKTVWQQEMERAAEDYAAQAKQRRQLSAHDVAADALEFVARDLRERARQLLEPQVTRTVPEYAAEQLVSTKTIRKWIREGIIPATLERGEWRIPAGTEPRIPQRKAS